MPDGWNISDDKASSPDRVSGIPHELKDASHGRRIQKVLAEAGVGSRRACETLIEEGKVKVNGHVVTDLPLWVDPKTDHITVRGKRVQPPEDSVYVMLFKPRGVVCSNDDPEGRKRAIDLVNHPSHARLYPVGRLDIESSGLLLLTNDGELAQRLTHPKHGVHKKYEVTVSGELTPEAAKKVESGIFLTDQRKGRRKKTTPGSKTRQSKLTVVKQDRNRTRLLLELGEGRNRQIRRMMAQLGYPVKKLRRIQLGPLKLKGLRPQQWRELLPQEIAALRKAAGLANDVASG